MFPNTLQTIKQIVPMDIIEIILSFEPDKDTLIAFVQTCKRFYKKRYKYLYKWVCTNKNEPLLKHVSSFHHNYTEILSFVQLRCIICSKYNVHLNIEKVGKTLSICEKCSEEKLCSYGYSYIPYLHKGDFFYQGNKLLIYPLPHMVGCSLKERLECYYSKTYTKQILKYILIMKKLNLTSSQESLLYYYKFSYIPKLKDRLDFLENSGIHKDPQKFLSELESSFTESIRD
tara:strand:+ start:92 stop:781 length:690 start_codon:yes stop_codon:yes gene_type:complete